MLDNRQLAYALAGVDSDGEPIGLGEEPGVC